MIQMKPLHQKKLNAGSFCVKEKQTMAVYSFFIVLKFLRTFLAALSCYRSIDFCLLGCWLAAFVKSLHLQVYLNNK